MTMYNRAGLIRDLQIEGVTEAALDSWTASAVESHVGAIRADSAEAGMRVRRSYAGHDNSAAVRVNAVRAAVRQHVAQNVARTRMLHADAEVPEHREIELCEALCDALGIRADGNDIEHETMRADANFFAEQLTSRSTEIIRPNDVDEVVRAALPVRNVEPYAEYVDLDFLKESGKAALITPEQRDFNRVNYGVARDKARMHWFGIATHVPWSSAVYSQAPTAIDEAAEKARMARRALERLQEEILIAGVDGIDFNGLATAPIPRIISTVNFATATLGEKCAEITRLLQLVRSSADFVGAAPSVGLIDPRLAFNLRASNNLDAGGNIVGAGPINAAMSTEGLRNVVEAPSMEANFPSPAGANYAQLVVYNPNTQGRIRQLVGLPPSPVSTAEIHGTETLWAMKHGGIELGDVSSVAILDIQIA
jgi:hypothetical protein